MTGALALLAGVLLGLGSAQMPLTAWMLSAGVTVTLVFTTSLRRRPSLRVLAALLCGMLLAWNSTQRWMDLRVPSSPGDTRVLFEGFILTVPSRQGAELHFDMAGVIVGGRAGEPRIRRARLGWRDAPFAPRVGERWRFVVRLDAFSDTRNFAGSDTARFAFRDRIHLAGRVLPSMLNTPLRLAHPSIDTVRARIAATIRGEIADPDAAALLTALAVGLTDSMSADQWRVFNATGTTHLVAISGLHVTLFALIAFAVARFAWRRLPGVRRCGREPFAMLLGLGAAGGYSMLAGFSVPTQRTWLMLAIFAAARVAARHVSAGHTWALALVAVLLLDPFAPLAAGFWLSFVAVAVILAAAGAASGNARTLLARASGAARLQFAIMLTLAPLTFAVFDGMSIAGLWVNLLAIPFISFVLVPLVLAGALAVLVLPSFSAIFFKAAAFLYELTWPGLTWAADGPLAMWRASPPPWWFACALFAGVVLLMRWPLALRFSAACAALPLLFAPARMPEPGTVRVSVLDAGRGTAVLLATHSHVMLFDTGDSWNTRGARLRELVLPALDALGRSSVDMLVLPALNDDRAKAAAVLAFERRVHQVTVGGGWPATSLPAVTCANSQFRWDDVEFRIFAGGRGSRFCVLRVSVGAHAILLAGDLDAAAERGLLSRLMPGAVKSDAVVIGRQASSRGSSPEWIEACAAGLSIATGGIVHSRSRDETLERWRKSGAVVLDSRRDGAIQLGLGTAGVSVLAVAAATRYPFVWRRLQ
ncbi:MAG: DNA internalization-related competence protein ComEC/Rec2 [Pseudomonadota bacterium]